MRRRWQGQLALCLLSVLLLTGCARNAAEQQDQGTEQKTDSELKVTFFDVGKGDAVLLESEGQAMLIDAGYDDTADVLLDYLEAEEIQQLDYMIITHFDKDHVGGADKVLEAVEVRRVLQPDYESDSRQTEQYLEALDAENIEPEKVTERMEFALAEAGCTIYPPRQKDYEEKDNDFSLVLSLTFGEERFLFAGDCEKERLSELMAEPELELEHQVLKVPHHGREEKNSDKFLLAVSPEAAVITCSEEEEPDKEILELLGQLGAEVYLTSEGTVTCVTDGSSLSFSQN